MLKDNSRQESNLQYLRAVNVRYEEHLIINGSFWANVATLYDINWPEVKKCIEGI